MKLNADEHSFIPIAGDQTSASNVIRHVAYGQSNWIVALSELNRRFE